MTEPALDNEWDLGELIAERKQPTDQVEIYLNEAASYAKAQLVKTLLNMPDDADAIEKVEEEIAKLDKLIESTKYTFVLTAIPNRMREDFASKALASHPMHLDYAGRDDISNQLERMIAENRAIWAAQIIDVINPSGAHKTKWTIEEIGKLQDSLPEPAKNAINAAIGELQNAAEQYSVKSKDPDFS